MSSIFTDEKTGQSGVSFPRRKFDGAMARIVRGLHWHHYREMLNPTSPITVWRLRRDAYEGLRSQLEVDLQSDHVGYDQFSYLHGRPKEDTTLSIWLLAFYRNVFIGVITGRKIEDDEFETLTE